MSTEPSQSKLKNFINFAIMFLACIAGSIAIFVFAVGMETGDRVIETMMTALIKHAAIVIGVFIAFNIFIFLLYFNRKGIRS